MAPVLRNRKRRDRLENGSELVAEAAPEAVSPRSRGFLLCFFAQELAMLQWLSEPPSQNLSPLPSRHFSASSILTLVLFNITPRHGPGQALNPSLVALVSSSIC